MGVVVTVADGVGLDVGDGVEVARRNVAVGVNVGVEVLVGVAVGPGGGFETVPQSAGQLVFVSPV